MPIQRMYVLWCDKDCGAYHQPENNAFAREVGTARKLARADGWKVPSNTKMSNQEIVCPACRQAQVHALTGL